MARSIASIGDKLGTQATVLQARLAMEQQRRQVEDLAHQLGADLSDPSDFQMVQQLLTDARRQ